MATDNPSAGESAQPPALIKKSAQDVGHAVETTPLSRVAVPNTHIRESAHDVQYSVDTTPASRVVAPEPPVILSPARPAPVPDARPDVNTGGNPTADQQR